MKKLLVICLLLLSTNVRADFLIHHVDGHRFILSKADKIYLINGSELTQIGTVDLDKSVHFNKDLTKEDYKQLADSFTAYRIKLK